MILEAFKVLENAHKIGTHIHSFEEYLSTDINWDEEFYVGDVSTFVSRESHVVD